MSTFIIDDDKNFTVESYEEKRDDFSVFYYDMDDLIIDNNTHFNLAKLKQKNKFLTAEDGRYINALRINSDYMLYTTNMSLDDIFYEFFEPELYYLNNLIYSYSIEIEMGEIESLTTKKNIATIYALNKYGFSILDYKKYNIQSFMFDWETINNFFLLTDINALNHYQNYIDVRRVLFGNAYNNTIVEKYKTNDNYKYVLLRYLSDNNLEMFKKGVVENNITIDLDLLDYLKNEIIDVDFLHFIIEQNPSLFQTIPVSFFPLSNTILQAPLEKLKNLCVYLNIFVLLFINRSITSEMVNIFIENNIIEQGFFINLLKYKRDVGMIDKNWYYLLSSLKNNTQRQEFMSIMDNDLYKKGIEHIINDIFDMSLIYKYSSFLDIKTMTITILNRKQYNGTYFRKIIDTENLRNLVKSGTSIKKLYKDYEFNINLVKDLISKDVYEKYNKPYNDDKTIFLAELQSLTEININY